MLTEAVKIFEIARTIGEMSSVNSGPLVVENEQNVSLDPTNMENTENTALNTPGTSASSSCDAKFSFTIDPDSEHPNEFTKKTKTGRTSHFGIRNRIPIEEVLENGARSVDALAISEPPPAPRVIPLKPIKPSTTVAAMKVNRAPMEAAKTTTKSSVAHIEQQLKAKPSKSTTSRSKNHQKKSDNSSKVVSINKEDAAKMQEFVHSVAEMKKKDQQRKEELRNLEILNCHDLTEEDLRR